MDPCEHFHPLSTATGLDSEGGCLTCGVQWGGDDIRAAVTASRAELAKATVKTLKTHCPICGPRTINPAAVTIHPADWSFHCTGCANTVMHALTPQVDYLLRLAGVPYPITEDDADEFTAALNATDDLAALAAHEGANR